MSKVAIENNTFERNSAKSFPGLKIINYGNNKLMNKCLYHM